MILGFPPTVRLSSRPAIGNGHVQLLPTTCGQPAGVEVIDKDETVRRLNWLLDRWWGGKEGGEEGEKEGGREEGVG